MHQYDDLTTAPPAPARGSTPAQDAIRLHRMVGNRAFARLLARDAANQRPMGGKSDEAKPDLAGNRWVWDEFDRTLTIFAVAGGGMQIVYKAGAPEVLAKLEHAGVESAVVLSATRAKVLDFLRVSQGKYQEKESDIAARLAANPGQTLCNKFTGEVVSLLGRTKTTQAGGLDPRAMAMKNQLPGAFHTLEDRPEGPKPGDIVSYGEVLPARKPGELRRANFQTIKHIGVFKSRRTGSKGEQIWTVVDGGQGTIKTRQEIRERTRIFATEELEIDVPKAFVTEGKWKGSVKHAEKETMKVGVLTSKLADAGQEGDKLLRGWLDIDEFGGKGAAPAVSSAGVNNRVFVGNEGAAESAARAGVLARRVLARERSWHEKHVDAVRDAVTRNDYVSPAPAPPAGETGPVNGGGAFWYLNGLSPEDMVKALRKLTAAERTQLLDHVPDAVGRFDVPRLRVAINAAGGDRARAQKAVENLDATRHANPPSGARTTFDSAVASGNWAVAWNHLNALNMYEMTHSLEGIGDARRTQLFANRPAGVDTATADYARSVVENRQLPAVAPGNLEASGAVGTAADFVAEQLFWVAAPMNANALPHLRRLLEGCRTAGITDKSQIAYVLASAHWESQMGRSMVEFASGAAYENRRDLGNTQAGDGPRYKGRGYVQITGRNNYQQYTNRLGVDLINNPDQAADPDVAKRIVTDGMLHGRFTGRGLARYGTDGTFDFVDAREIVNGHDHDADIAAIARSYRAAMNRP